MLNSAWLIPALVLNTFAMTLVFGLSWLVLRRYPLPFFRPWVWSEGCRTLSSVFGTVCAAYAPTPILMFLTVAGTLYGSLFLMESARAYRGDEGPWPSARALLGICLLLSFGLAVAFHDFAAIAFLPAFVALSGAQLWSAYAYWPKGSAPAGIGARTVAVGSLLWGVEWLPYPLIIAFAPRLLSLSTILSSLLAITVGMGMIVHLLELSNRREQDTATHVRATNDQLVTTLNALSASRSETQLYTEMAKEQEALVRQIVHDLRNASQAMSLILEEMEDEAQGQPRLMGLLNALDRQVSFISTFLKQKLAWIADRQAPSAHHTTLPPVLKSLESTFAPMLAGKRQTLAIEPPREPSEVGISAIELEQLLSNVLSNAHRHCPPETHVRLWTALSDGWITLYIADDGPGISLEQQALIGRMAPRADGTGVGLRNVLDLVQRAGGTMGFSSEAGRGTTFHVTLPLLSWGQVADGAQEAQADGQPN
ncbi:MAG TPA: HAMP domain-containing sensor histidine kinase [Oscillatoriaceae cyanobacterium]